jgi:cellulose synthase/poly-beta-1,6-N-acetylglucosamine synthase-like glycosyltransferase
MWEYTSDGWTYLMAQSGESLLGLFWFTAIFDIPRYLFSFISVAALHLAPYAPCGPGAVQGRRVTVLIVGHNEAQSIVRCVLSLREQSRRPDQIIVVSDGSTDRMTGRLKQLQRDGLIHEALCTQVRSGKSAAFNLALSRATGDLIVSVDCDCTLDRHALARILEPFEDPKTGAVAGNIVVANASDSLVTRFQAIEYLISISLGKQAADFSNQVGCVSGAFGAFRRTALERAGGLDPGGGEDLDVTLRLRKAEWVTRFEPEAVCYTNVPTSLSRLIRQRFRWERDAVRLRYRRHRDLLNPFNTRFSVSDLLNELDFVLFSVGATICFPFYLVWLFVNYGDVAILILVGAQLGMFAFDGASFLLAALVAPMVKAWPLAPYWAGYSLFSCFVMRFVRLSAYVQEWVLQASYRDSFVPRKVHRVRM